MKRVRNLTDCHSLNYSISTGGEAPGYNNIMKTQKPLSCKVIPLNPNLFFN